MHVTVLRQVYISASYQLASGGAYTFTGDVTLRLLPVDRVGKDEPESLCHAADAYVRNYAHPYGKPGKPMQLRVLRVIANDGQTVYVARPEES